MLLKICYTNIMPSLFPELFTYGFLATGVLRITLGLIFIWLAYKMFFRERTECVAFFEELKLRPAKFFFAITAGLGFIAVVGLLIGFYMQITALIIGILMTIATFIKWYSPSVLHRNTIEFYILLTVLSFSLVFLGPGAFAFDLPL